MSEDNTYIKYTRDLHHNEAFKSLSFEYRHIYLTILVHMAFEPIELNDHGVLIQLQPGQYMTTIRRLTELCDEKVISKGKVERALKMFEKIGFSRQETRHTKTIITITQSSVCAVLKNRSETTNETRSRQDRDKIETQKKNIKELKEEHTHQGECEVLPSKEKISQEPKKFIPSTYKSKSYQPAIQKKSYGESGLVQLYEEEYEKLVSKDGMTTVERDYWIGQVELTMQRQGINEFNKNNKNHYYTIKAWIDYRKRNEKVIPIHTSPAKIFIKTAENKITAEQALKNYFSNTHQIIVTYNRLEINSKGYGSHVDVLKFDENGFEEQLKCLLQKRGFERVKVRERA